MLKKKKKEMCVFKNCEGYEIFILLASPQISFPHMLAEDTRILGHKGLFTQTQHKEHKLHVCTGGHYIQLPNA